MAKSKSTDTGDTETLSKGAVAENLRGLTATLKGDLTKLAGSKADKAIATWESILESVGTGVKPVRTDLGKLREHVTSDEPDGKAIAKLLTSLSTKTAKVADDQTGIIGTALKSLSSTLEQAATSLTESGKSPQ
jgi:hypothetical protein